MKCIRRSLWRTTPWIVVSTAAFGLALSAHSAPPAETPAAPPAAPKVSTFAPAADLAAQADGYLAAITDAVDNFGNFVDSKEQLAKDSNTLIVIALALGLSDQPNKYKAGAPGHPGGRAEGCRRGRGGHPGASRRAQEG